MTSFRDIEIGATFDFINDESPWFTLLHHLGIRATLKSQTETDTREHGK